MWPTQHITMKTPMFASPLSLNSLALWWPSNKSDKIRKMFTLLEKCNLILQITIYFFSIHAQFSLYRSSVKHSSVVLFFFYLFQWEIKLQARINLWKQFIGMPWTTKPHRIFHSSICSQQCSGPRRYHTIIFRPSLVTTLVSSCFSTPDP